MHFTKNDEYDSFTDSFQVQRDLVFAKNNKSVCLRFAVICVDGKGNLFPGALFIRHIPISSRESSNGPLSEKTTSTFHLSPTQMRMRRRKRWRFVFADLRRGRD
ncbi:hypothetical protein Ddc_09294 [Ditylenchus destructor]|nr:hypothetical protein Ddc_09294 [Ditylenchus destructor]